MKRQTLSRVSNTRKALKALDRLLNKNVIDIWQWGNMVEAEKVRRDAEVIGQLVAKWGSRFKSGVYKTGYTNQGRPMYNVELRGGIMTYVLRRDRLVRYRYVRYQDMDL